MMSQPLDAYKILVLPTWQMIMMIMNSITYKMIYHDI